MAESRCGVRCDLCIRKEAVHCKGCVMMDAPFWGGKCGVKSCCEEKGWRHCGECDQFPCKMLLEMGKDQGFDPAPKIRQCREWAVQTVEIVPGRPGDIDALTEFYEAICDHLEGEDVVNYPGWKKGVYPGKQEAEKGVENNTLYIAKYNDKIVGSIILNHEPEKEPDHGSWQVEAQDDEVYVIHTYAVHPAYMGRGIGAALLAFAEETAKKDHMAAIRLDVYENNEPACRLYEKFGYRYIDTVDLGLSCYGLDWFRLYEKVISEKRPEESGADKALSGR